MFYRFTRWSFATIMALAVALSSSSSARAVTCSGSGCNNTNPITTGCNADAATVKKVFPASGKARVELRFSDTCQTRWAKTINISPNGLNYWANATLGYWYYGSQYVAYGNTVYSNQRYGSGYQACGDVTSTAINTTINDAARCTASY